MPGSYWCMTGNIQELLLSNNELSNPELQKLPENMLQMCVMTSSYKAES